MFEPAAPIRRCPDCGEEFQPHVVTCSDCGAPLENAFEGEDPSAPPEDVSPPDPVSVELTVLLTVDAATADRAARHLSAEGVPFRVASDKRFNLRLAVEREHVARAQAVLVREGLLPDQPDPTAGAVGEEGGPCPACGDPVAPGTLDCPGCGLQLAGPVECRRCGAELDPDVYDCPRCAAQPD